MQLDELFYLKNPRDLYAHWDLATWSKIEGHMLEPGRHWFKPCFRWATAAW